MLGKGLEGRGSSPGAASQSCVRHQTWPRMGSVNYSFLFARICQCSLFLLVALDIPGAETGTLQAGAARVDITPAEGAALPMSGYAGRQQGFQGIHDRIYARAIVLHDGARYAAIVTWELIGVPSPVWAEVSERIAKETGISHEFLLLAAVHDHSAPSLAGMYGNADPKSVPYTTQVEDATVEAIRQAKANLQPARVGVGAGKAYVNVNRREYAPDRGWGLGFNPDFPSDKTLTVVRFETMSGKPIALFINYAVHAVVMGPENFQISGDLAGATSRFVEQHYKGAAEDRPRGDAGSGLRLRPEETVGGDGIVALWTSGAAGDQNPLSVARGSDFTLVNAFGKILGEEAIRVAGKIRTTPNVRIRGVQQVVTCSGRKLAPGPRPQGEYKFEDAAPVDIRLGLLTINQIALAGVSGEVLTGIGRRLQKETPFSQTIMVTHGNGSSGYIPDDAAFDHIGYEITTSHLKPGCAENAIVNGFLDMIQQR
jgi:neutral ceramidase